MISVKLSAKGLHRAVRKVQKDVQRITMAALEEIAEQAIEYAYELYRKAEFAGVDVGTMIDDGVLELGIDDAGPLSLEIFVLVGEEIAEYIEYGTGQWRSGMGYTHPQTGHPFWFFYGEGRDIKLNDYVQKAKPRVTKYEWAPIEYTTTLRGKTIVSKWGWKKLDEPVVDNKEDTFWTEGNPANHVMEQVREYVRKITPGIVEKHFSKQR